MLDIGVLQPSHFKSHYVEYVPGSTHEFQSVRRPQNIESRLNPNWTLHDVTRGPRPQVHYFWFVITTWALTFNK